MAESGPGEIDRPPADPNLAAVTQISGTIGAVPPTAEDIWNTDLENFQAGYITVVPIRADYTADNSSWVKFNPTVNTFNLAE